MDTPLFIPGWSFQKQIFQEIFEKTTALKIKSNILIGWSFGGLEAIKKAMQFHEKYEGLILLNSTPKFMEDSSWPGITKNAKSYFILRLEGSEKCFKSYYLSLVGKSSKADRHFLLPSSKNRRDLNDLFNSDLRKTFSKIKLPILSIMGMTDQIVPHILNTQLHRLNTNVETVTLANEGHDSFLNNPDLVAKIMDKFIREKC